MTEVYVEFITGCEAFLWGIGGGFAAEMLGWYKLRQILHKDCPDFAKSIPYWILTIIMIILGGGLVYTYVMSGFKFKPLLAINVGATAPLILEALTRQAPSLSPGKNID